MSSVVLSRACALGFAFAIAFLALAAVVPAAKAAPNPIDPAAMTVSVVLDKSSYLSGDTASARAIVYRTPAPGNYTYVWRVRNLFFQLLNTTTTAGAVFNYPIALAYTGTLRFEATVDDGQGTVVAGQQSATVAQAYMSLTLDRGDYNPGDTISAFYGVSSHVIMNPAYSYAVTDTNTVVVFSGTTNATFFSFATPNPSSRSYTFRVTATDRGNSTQALATINQATGFVLGMSFDRASYAGPVPHDPRRDRERRPRRVRERIEHRRERVPDGPGGSDGERVLVHGGRGLPRLRDRPQRLVPRPPGRRDRALEAARRRLRAVRR